MKRLQLLSEDAHCFDFYEAVRQIECHHKEKPRVGETLQPSDDIIRFGQKPSSFFAPSTIASIDIEDQGLVRMQVYFYGMFGPNGPLPLHLTEYTQDRKTNAKDEALSHFMDIFHHRLLSLFYRAWANKEPTVQYDRPDDDRFHFYIGSMLGIGSPALQNRDEMQDNSKLQYAGHMSSQTQHAEGLSSILQSFFKAPVKINEYIGEWLEIPKDSRCYMGTNPEGGTLGVDAVLGGKSWQRQYKFRVIVGPMGLEEYENLLPDKNKLKQVSTIIRNYLGFEFNWDVNLILKKQEIPQISLGKYGNLGWSSWLHNQPPCNDSDDFLAN